MNNQLTETLGRVAEDTLEQLAFIFSESQDSPAESDESEPAAVRIQFSGAFSGELVAALSRSVLPELAANMLGLDDGSELALDQQQDALGEVLNVLCGNLLPEIAGSKAVFDLQAPETLDGPALERALAGRAPRARVTMGLEEGMLELILFHEDFEPESPGSAN